MARVAFFNVPAHGHVNPTLGVVKGLVDRGEEVLYHTHPEFLEKVEATGATFCQGDPPLDYDHTRPDMNLLVLASVLMESSSVLLDRYLELYPPGRIDYVIHDSMCPWGRMFAQVRGLPSVCSTSTFAMSWPVALSGGMRGDLLAMTRRGIPGAVRYLRHAWRLWNRHPVWGMGLMRLFSNPGDLTIVYTSRMLQPRQERFDTTYRFVGPSIAERRPETDFPLHRLVGAGVVYVSLGTLMNDRTDIYRSVIQALAGSDLVVVLSVGTKIDIASLGLLPDNFIVRSSVPQIDVLERARLFVTHAGMNSVHEGLIAGVPLLLVPQTAEQAMVARRVEKLGAGAILSEADLDPPALGRTVTSLMGSRAHVEAARRLGDSLGRAGGWRAAVDEILSFTRARGIA